MRFALMTAAGAGAIASIVVVGDDLRARLRPMLPALATIAPDDDRLHLSDVLDCAAQPFDRALISCSAPGSSGTQRLHLHLHGAPAIVAQASATLIALGAELTPSRTLATSAALARSVPPRAAACLALAPTANGRCGAAWALHQGAGALERLVLASDGDRATLGKMARTALAAAALTRAVLAPPHVLFHGAAGVGKSSLINALLGRDRLIVGDQPGVTRDVLEVAITIAGFEVILIDTPGERETDSAAERQGQSRGRDARARADLSIRVVDGRSTDQVSAKDKSEFVVATHADLATPARGLAVSSLSGQGLDELRAALARHLDLRAPSSALELLPLLPHEAALLATIAHASDHASSASAIASLLRGPPLA